MSHLSLSHKSTINHQINHISQSTISQSSLTINNQPSLTIYHLYHLTSHPAKSNIWMPSWDEKKWDGGGWFSSSSSSLILWSSLSVSWSTILPSSSSTISSSSLFFSYPMSCLKVGWSNINFLKMRWDGRLWDRLFEKIFDVLWSIICLTILHLIHNLSSHQLSVSQSTISYLTWKLGCLDG